MNDNPQVRLEYLMPAEPEAAMLSSPLLYLPRGTIESWPA
jgi:hypothetical protein